MASKERIALVNEIVEELKTGKLIYQEADSLLSAIYAQVSCKQQDRTRLTNYLTKKGISP